MRDRAEPTSQHCASRHSHNPNDRTADIRRDAVHKLTTRLAKTHGETVIEDLDVAGMRKGEPSTCETRR